MSICKVTYMDIISNTSSIWCIVIIAEDMESDKVQVITGVNLAMILQILSVREANDVDVAELLKAGNDGIADLKAILKANM